MLQIRNRIFKMYVPGHWASHNFQIKAVIKIQLNVNEKITQTVFLFTFHIKILSGTLSNHWGDENMRNHPPHNIPIEREK